MDHFLRDQALGNAVDSEVSFTLSPEKAREKIIHSIPKAKLETVFRLLDAALLDLGYSPSECITYRAPNDLNFNIELFQVKLVDFGVERSRALLHELRAPFGAERGIRRLAQAVFIAAQNGKTVSLSFHNSPLSFASRLKFSSDNFEVPHDFQLDKAGTLTFELAPKLSGSTSRNGYPEYVDSPNRKLQSSLHLPERILPLESLIHSSSGSFFRERAHPFTAIRSYAHKPAEEQSEGMQLDLWDGPYTPLDASTVVLNRKEEGRFLFLRWRPDYGRPTILHHSLDSDLNFGPQTCRGTFMITSSDQPPEIYFLSEGIVADPVTVEGPKGLIGLVVWPGFRYDLWGTQPVKDATYEVAMDWTQTQVRATADRLAIHLDQVIDRVTTTRLLKARYYADEIAKWMRIHWGK